jgi:hypothetical protein
MSRLAHVHGVGIVCVCVTARVVVACGYSTTGGFDYHFEEVVPPPARVRRYSIVLTKFMFMNADALFMYTCLLPRSIHAYVDGAMNCEDIAMNMMWTGTTGQPPLMVNTDTVVDYGTAAGLSTRATHAAARSTCVTDLLRLFGSEDVLRYRDVAASPYVKAKYTKRAFTAAVNDDDGGPEAVVSGDVATVVTTPPRSDRGSTTR